MNDRIRTSNLPTPIGSGLLPGQKHFAQAARGFSHSASRDFQTARSFDQTPGAALYGSVERTAGHNFGQMRVDSAAVGDEVERSRKMDAQVGSPASTGSSAVNRGISASGAGTVRVKYTPEATDTSSKIVFIQVMTESLDGTPVKPSASTPGAAYLDADTTADFYHVDYQNGESDPYYNGDDAKDFGTQGNATSTPKIDSEMDDTPGPFNDGDFPVGKSKLRWEFRSIAFSAAGADQGKFYGYAKWSYEKEKGKPEATKHEGTSTETSLPKSKAAINLFCSNHGFVLPK